MVCVLHFSVNYEEYHRLDYHNEVEKVCDGKHIGFLIELGIFYFLEHQVQCEAIEEDTAVKMIV